jgi:hypothetical protein
VALEKDAMLTQIDDMLARADVEAGAVPDWEYYNRNYDDSWRAQRTTACVAAIERFTEPESAYRRTAQEPSANQWLSSDSSTLVHIIGVLLALRADIDAGYLRTIEELVHAEVFADFLEMASELQKSGYKDAAAVIAGSTLEEHLRKLAGKAQIPTTTGKGDFAKASRLNDDLKATSVYNALQHRSVQAWLDLRNDAAHGNYGEYDHKQVAALIRDVGDFMARHPA